MSTELYTNTPAVGLLKGFSPLPYQLEVEVVVPHQERGLPGFGEFLLVELSASEALVGRVSRYHAAGQLATDRGDAYLVDLAKTEDVVPAPLMRQMLRYNLKMQLLGQLQIQASDKFKFSVGERAFATLGRKVRVPSDAALAFLCNVGLEDDPTAVPLGHLAYGQRELKNVPVRFSVNRLKGKRSFVFARAGYGKSNLIKYLMSQLYASPPDVGLLIFDPEGEYALPDAHGRPGLVNVPALRDRISLYTNRKVDSEHRHFAKGEMYVDFGDFPPQDIVAAFIPAEKQEMVFANLLRSLKWEAWRELVELLAKDEYAADEQQIARLLRYKPRKEDVSLGAIKNNLLSPIRRLHRPGATLGKNIIEELKRNRVVIADVSLLGSEDGLAVTGMLMRRIFQNNVRHLTDRQAGQTVRCLVILEEAQTMLGDRSLDDRNMFVRWVKEGRKYGLGCVLVTQQPSSISDQIISQGDNFFVLHLLNENDLQTLKRHNAYFSDEILGFIRGEPIPGNCYFWSAPSQPFVLPVRVCNFENLCQQPAKPAKPVATAASNQKVVRNRIAEAVKEAIQSNTRVWVFLVSTLHGKNEAGLVAFSREFLQEAVAERICEDPAFNHVDDGGQWLQNQLPVEIESVLKRHKVRTGFAVLAGVSRAVWVLPQTEIKLVKGKSARPQPVEVIEEI